jgi:large subunit ribosomal protein L9
MRVILKQDIPTLGRAGDIKDVKDGYARNFLFPRGLVMNATVRSVKEKAFSRTGSIA